MPDPQTVEVTHPPKPPDKPGWKTTEFYLTMVALVLGGLVQFDVIPVEGEGTWPKIVALGLQVLAAMGYQVSRGKAKSGGGFTIKLGLALCLSGLLLVGSGCNGGRLAVEGLTMEMYPEVCDSAEPVTVPLVATPGAVADERCYPVAVSAPLATVPGRVVYRAPALAYAVPAAPMLAVPERKVPRPPGARAPECPPCPPCPECPR